MITHCAAAIIALLLGLPPVAVLAVEPPVDAQLLKLLPANCAQSPGGLDSLARAFDKTEQDLKKWSLSVSADLSSDDAGGSESSKWGVAIDLKRGDYPRQLRFAASSSVRYEAGSLSEEVTKFVLNYDYYLVDQLEVFFFGERFADTYLGIDQRYEIGCGLKIERIFTDRSKSSHLSALAVVAARVGADCRDALQESPLRDYLGLIDAGMKRQNAVLTVGLAASIFREMEDAASLAATIADRDTTVDLAPEQFYRVALRPSLRLRVTRDLSLNHIMYFKRRIFDDREDRPRSDYRIDSKTAIAIILAKDRFGDDKVELRMEYTVAYDNDPPGASLAGIRHTWPLSHRQLKLLVRVSVS